MYPDDPHNTWLATTSNDVLVPKADKIAPLFVKEVHWGEHFHLSLVREGAPLKMGHFRQVRDTPQVI